MNSMKAKKFGYFTAAITLPDTTYISQRRAEAGDDRAVYLSRLLEYIYVANKASIYDSLITFIESFYKYLQTDLAGKLEIDTKGKMDHNNQKMLSSSSTLLLEAISGLKVS